MEIHIWCSSESLGHNALFCVWNVILYNTFFTFFTHWQNGLEVYGGVSWFPIGFKMLTMYGHSQGFAVFLYTTPPLSLLISHNIY